MNFTLHHNGSQNMGLSQNMSYKIFSAGCIYYIIVTVKK
jgi:hypothetical protein